MLRIVSRCALSSIIGRCIIRYSNHYISTTKNTYHNRRSLHLSSKNGGVMLSSAHRRSWATVWAELIAGELGDDLGPTRRLPSHAPLRKHSFRDSSTRTQKHTLATPRTANGRGLRIVRPIDPRSAYRGQHNVLGWTCVSSHVWCLLAVKTSVV